jgi:hypothetical protein
VKIQYPNIARAIRNDFKNLNALLLPLRFTRDREALRGQREDLFRTLERETDYGQEAEFLEAARRVFREEDEIVVPRVYARFSTRRVLTMEYLPGKHAAEYMAAAPPQEERDRYGRQLFVASMRLYYSARTIYADPHPGNFLFMDDGRLGLIDFGCCYRFTEDTWDFCCQAERALNKGPRHPDMREVLAFGAALDDVGKLNEEWLGLLLDYSEWVNEPLRFEGHFDFRDLEYLRRGVHTFGELVRRGYTRAQPVNTWLARCFIGLRGMLYRLRAQVNVHQVWERETTIT